MFARFLSTRTPAASSSRAPVLQSGPSTQSASRRSPSLFKKVFNIKKAFHRSSSAAKNADSEGTSHRRQGAPSFSQPSQGLNALAYDRAGFDPRSSLHPHVEPTRSAASLSPPPCFQAEWQSSTSSAHHRSNFSATASPLLAPPQSVATTSATSFAHNLSSSNYSTQSAAPRSATSPNASLLAPPAVATIPATTSAPARSSSLRSATSRSTFSPKISSPLAPPRSVATTPATTFSSSRRPSQRPAVFTAPQSTSSFDASPLLAPPQSVATTPATEHSATFSPFDCSKPSDNSSTTHQLIAELEETVAYLQGQYNDARRCVHTMIQWHVFPYAKSLTDEAKKAKEELDEVMKQIVAVDTDCSELEALLRDEYEKLEETEEALKKAYWHREGANEEHALLQDDVHELQAGQPVNGVWQQRASEPFHQDYTPSQSVVEQERGSSLAASESFRLERKVVNSWDSRWESMIARQRYSLPRSVHAVEAVTTSEQEASRSASDGGRAATPAALDSTQRMTPGESGKKTSRPVTAQGPVVACNKSGRRTTDVRVRDAHQADTSDYFGRPLRWGQLAPSSPVRARKSDIRSSKHA